MTVEEKLSNLTSIPVKFINQVKAYLNLIHSDDLYQQLTESKDSLKIPILEGDIFLELDEKDELSFSFIPNKDFIDIVLKTFKEKKSSLDICLDKKLKTVLQNTYKGLF